MRPVAYRNVLPSDSERLPPVARGIYARTFARHFDAEEFARHCDAIYGPGGSMAMDLQNPDILWRIAEAEGVPIGYAKLRPLVLPVAGPQPGAMELQQIYVSYAWHGRGVAAELMEWVIATATQRGAPELYLAVFDYNERAKAFYSRYGFREVGHCTFALGGRAYDDRIWQRPLLEA